MLPEIEGRELLNFIEQLGELAWAKFETRYPTIVIKGSLPSSEDRSGRPPYTSFRFEHESPDVIERLQDAVRNYHGSLEWVMEGHQRVSFPGTTNWIIHPKKMAEIRQSALDSNLTPGQYMAKADPMFGPVAYNDFANLTAHLLRTFRDY
ncbi:hypothetical protein LXA47_01090 [Massilia sp. P8910]|uniref:hypothetical protein n=1 Tax=Massilia antarctica TaxID=2765360 RepID=UPI001E62AC80|nr:hypothetical protein [Massilia antarctica]MCE3602209.1 hypothetical protein [Massilia antarctica]